MFDIDEPEIDCEFILVPDLLKVKLGTGKGLPKTILENAQNALEKESEQFKGHIYDLIEGLEKKVNSLVIGSSSKSNGILTAIDEAINVKSHGGMLKNNLITEIGLSISSFLELIDIYDFEADKVSKAHIVALKISLSKELKDIQQGKMMFELSSACNRYFAMRASSLK